MAAVKNMIYDICLLIQDGFSDTAIMELYGITSGEIDYIRSHYYGSIILGLEG